MSRLLGSGGSLPTPHLRLSARVPRQKFRVEPQEPHRNPEGDIERAIAARVLEQAIRDYHAGQKLKQRKNVLQRFNNRNKLDFLTAYEQKQLFEGKSAWEWFTKEPIPGEEGYTLQDCCELLSLDLTKTREDAMKVSTSRRLDKMCAGGFYKAPVQP